MAKRLIDAEALWHRLEAEPWYDNADRDEVALPLVDDAPTVDAVEVCYCKDCKHYALWADGRAMNHCDKHDRTAYDDDFCSYGERKEG